jgi:hypothetical protein
MSFGKERDLSRLIFVLTEEFNPNSEIKKASFCG